MRFAQRQPNRINSMSNNEEEVRFMDSFKDKLIRILISSSPLVQLTYTQRGGIYKFYKNSGTISAYDESRQSFTASASFEVYSVKNNKFEVSISGKHIINGVSIRRFNKSDDEMQNVIKFIIENSGCKNSFSVELNAEEVLNMDFSQCTKHIRSYYGFSHGAITNTSFHSFVEPKGNTFIESKDVENHKYFLVSAIVSQRNVLVITDFDKYMIANKINDHYVRCSENNNVQFNKNDLDLLLTAIHEHKTEK